MWEEKQVAELSPILRVVRVDSDPSDPCRLREPNLNTTGINEISRLFSFHNICARGYSYYVLLKCTAQDGQINIAQFGRDLLLQILRQIAPE